MRKKEREFLRMKSEYYNAKTFPLLLHPLKRKINCCS
jgi:hypothetical protein